MWSTLSSIMVIWSMMSSIITMWINIIDNHLSPTLDWRSQISSVSNSLSLCSVIFSSFWMVFKLWSSSTLLFNLFLLSLTKTQQNCVKYFAWCFPRISLHDSLKLSLNRMSFSVKSRSCVFERCHVPCNAFCSSLVSYENKTKSLQSVSTDLYTVIPARLLDIRTHHSMITSLRTFCVASLYFCCSVLSKSFVTSSSCWSLLSLSFKATSSCIFAWRRTTFSSSWARSLKEKNKRVTVALCGWILAGLTAVFPLTASMCFRSSTTCAAKAAFSLIKDVQSSWI